MPRPAPASTRSREPFEALYAFYNRRPYVHPDPLEFLYRYPDLRDREIVAMIASSLAYGKVEQILKSVSKVLLKMGASPFDFVCSSPYHRIRSAFESFKHRFTPGEDISSLLGSAKSVIREHGSLQACFLAGYRDTHETVLPALSAFIGHLHPDRACCWSGFLPSPDKGSACKRLNLFLRWMVREDDVDPGGWRAVSPSKLVVPLDTHMHRISLLLGLTGRNQADLRTALEITRAFRRFSPEDPVRYDFVLTRFGIRRDMAETGLPALCGTKPERKR